MKRAATRRRRPSRIPVASSCWVEIIPDGKRITLVVPLPTPSLNEYYHAHWRKQDKAKADWALLLRSILGRQKLECKALGRRRVTVERRGVQALDVDNLYGGLKCVLIDNLRALELLCDDDAKSMDLVARNGKRPPRVEPHTVVILEDVV
jgi:hypothetical protein